MKRVLTVYYSWSNGNTERIAKMLQKEISGDIVRVDTITPYEPEIKPLGVNISDYDVIAVGTPTWWYTMAPAVLTFLHKESFADKTVIPFMTNAGWPGNVIKDMKTACKGADIKCEMQIQFDSTGGSRLETPMEDITKWIQNVKKIINN